jgi:hypothetical protein
MIEADLAPNSHSLPLECRREHLLEFHDRLCGIGRRVPRDSLQETAGSGPIGRLVVSYYWRVPDTLPI